MTPPFAPAIDAHVHVLPERLLAAVRNALNDEAGWEFAHPTDREAIEAVLHEAGVERYVSLPYAHRSGVAADLNEWVRARAEESEMLIPFATVHPDDDVADVVYDALEAGARGLKFHCPVQRCPPDDPRLDPAYELAADFDRPVLFHAGTAPMFRGDSAVGPVPFESFVASFPDVRACCAHMGAYDVEEFLAIADDYDSVFLDTTFAMSSAAERYMDFDPGTVADDRIEELSDSIMYGSDFPNIPYDYAAERDHLLSRDLSEATYRDVFRRTAERFLG
ncbi:amidohydrolase family protein [Haloplanus sp. GCM10025708]|uniref:amidohydrolase family protein n=1 Tax=Haloferacaceae TaxID=1644056 RepID=UPI00360735A5